MQVKATARFTHPEGDKFGRIHHVLIEDVIDVSEEQAKTLIGAGLATDDLSWTLPDPEKAGFQATRGEGVRVESDVAAPVPAEPAEPLTAKEQKKQDKKDAAELKADAAEANKDAKDAAADAAQANQDVADAKAGKKK